MGQLFRRFADPDMERTFVRSERRARGPALRALCVIAAVGLVGYMIANPLVLPREDSISYNIAAFGLIATLALLFLVSRTEFYADHPWIDLPIFILMDVGMAGLVKALADVAAVTGIPAVSMGLAQKGILVVFASIAFAGNFRLYLLWNLAVFGVLIWWTLGLPVAAVTKGYCLTNASIFFIFAIYFNWELDRRAREIFEAEAELAAERLKTEELLHSVLPAPIAARLKAGESVADSYADVTAIFADIVGFSSLARRLSPGLLVTLLNRFFSAADRCAERHGIEKVKTIGDAYLAVAGGTASQDRDARSALAFARDLVAELRAETAAQGAIELQVRIGIHCGAAVGGVIGTSRLAYDYWGDTMNIAARLQDQAPPDGIAVSESIYLLTRSEQDYQAPEKLALKGVGEQPVFRAQL
jgi:class 3 adenylate cyclase